MKVKELLELLGRMPPEQNVMVGYNYGDYRRGTHAVGPVREVVATMVTESGYSQDRLAVVEVDDEEGARVPIDQELAAPLAPDVMPDGQNVVVITCYRE